MKDKKINVHSDAGGIFWIMGWLFSIGFLNLHFWNAVLGIILWPYYLGSYFYMLHQGV
ncbi:MAG TPA: hypothetical protein VKD08_11565 [Ignavibacteriaceae bacterium]|jgi:hypothetical protein|nr:hypothetical protein [Ignavibacteriaceae bacterium]